MMVTMGIAFVIYLLLLEPMVQAWGLHGLWGAVLAFMAVRGLAQAIEARDGAQPWACTQVLMKVVPLAASRST